MNNNPRGRGVSGCAPNPRPGINRRTSDIIVAVLNEVTWRQQFRWGLLLAFDDELDWELPDDVGADDISATSTCLAVPVRHAYDVEIPEGWPDDALLPNAEVQVLVRLVHRIPDDVEFVARILCSSGRLHVGDAENKRVLDVPAGRFAVGITREPVDCAESVTIALSPR
jgi:hypothetical protein